MFIEITCLRFINIFVLTEKNYFLGLYEEQDNSNIFEKIIKLGYQKHHIHKEFDVGVLDTKQYYT